MYLILAALLTCVTMIWVARRMQARPNKVQTAVEALYQLMRDNITGGNLEDERMARRWFPFIATLFLFIMFSNLLGYIPLPTNTEHEFVLFGVHFPSFSLYAATANISIPLGACHRRLHLLHVRRRSREGPDRLPQGPGAERRQRRHGRLHLLLEVLSNLMRLLSLSIRLFANILAGHLIILFMAGGLAVILGVSALGWLTVPFGVALYAFEVGLVAALQAFIFATLTAIYLGGAVATEH